MITFYVAATFMVLIAVFPLMRILLRRPPAKNTTIDSNLKILRHHVQELDIDLQQGTITPDEYQDTKRELQHRVIEDTKETFHATITTPQYRVAFILLSGFIVSTGILYSYIGTPDALISTATQKNIAETSSVTAAQIQGMVSRLAEKLKANPNDPEGWRMLARSYETLRQFDKAADAYQHLLVLLPNNLNVLLNYAVTLAMHKQHGFSGEPEKLINRALTIDPENIQALALSGSVAFERKDYAEAIKVWRKILPLVSIDSEIAQTAKERIVKAEKLLKNPS